MPERKPCLRCQRTIDAVARLCPFCNWDQSRGAPPPATAAPRQPLYVPPEEKPWRGPLTAIGAFVLMLVTSFAVGALVNRDGTPKEAEEDNAAPAAPVRPAPRANVTLVPVNEPIVDVEEPITTAPVTTAADGVPPEYQRSDATAVSSAEYARLAQLARAEKKTKPPVDPRSVTGIAYAAAPRLPQARRESPPATAVLTSRPRPESQPLPDIRVRSDVTARLQLTVGPDGRVQEVNVLQGIGRDTGRLISAVQRWRFQPATANGSPVSAPYAVDISFNRDE